MKKYRIINHYNKGYIVQERYWIFFWYALIDCYPLRTTKRFSSIDEAKDFIKEKIERDKQYKKELKDAKYQEYV